MVKEEFVERVCEQIRCRKAHAMVREELEAHIADQRDAYIAGGEKLELAERKAVAEMGDPVAVGVQLDSAHRPKPAWGVVGMTACLVVAGILLQAWLGVNPAALEFGSWLVYVPMGIAIMGAAYFLDYTILARRPVLLFFICMIGAVAAVHYVAGFGPSLYYYSSDTAQYMAFLMAPVFAGCIYAARGRGYRGIMGCMLLMFLNMIQILAAPSMYTCFIFSGTAMLLLTVAIAKGHFGERKAGQLTFVWGTAFFFVLLVSLRILLNGYSQYRFERFLGAFFPLAADSKGIGYFTHWLRELVGQSQFIGISNGLDPVLIQQLSNDVSYQNDCMLHMAVIFKGVWSCALVVLLFVAFILCATYIAGKQRNVLGYLVSLSVVFTFGLSGIVYILSNFGLLGFIGGILPFLSKGGAGFLVCCFLLGLFLSVCKGNHYLRDKDIAAVQAGALEPPLGRWVDAHLPKYRLVVRLERPEKAKDLESMKGAAKHENR